MPITLRDIYFALLFVRNGFGGGLPKFIKNATLKRFAISDACWVETGTYRGETTRFLAKKAPFVHTIEPSKEIFEAAARKLAGVANIKCHLGTSEEVLPTLLPEIREDCNFWLDGHFSGGKTYNGTVSFPIMQELAAISDLLARGHSAAIFIDDVSLLSRVTSTSRVDCTLDEIVDWVRQTGYHWTIENDIMIITEGKQR